MRPPRLTTIARGAVALLAIIGLTVIVPLLLVEMIGNPLPHPWSWIQPLTDQAVLSVLACVAWLLWAQFAACLVIEVAAEIRLATGRSADWLSRAPGTWRGQQAFARTLVQAVVALGVASSAAATVPAWAPHAAAATTPAPGHARHTPEGSGRIRHAAPPAGAPTQAPTETVTVRRGDTLWSIAEAHLGAGERWRDIATLNNGRIMADGERFLNADRIRPGWTLLLPTPPAGSTGPASARTSRADTVTVEQGDTL
jgi:hypothetical protein